MDLLPCPNPSGRVYRIMAKSYLLVAFRLVHWFVGYESQIDSG